MIDHSPAYSGKQMVRGDLRIFSSKRSFLLRKRMMDVSPNHLLLHIESKSFRLSCMRFCKRGEKGNLTLIPLSVLGKFRLTCVPTPLPHFPPQFPIKICRLSSRETACRKLGSPISEIKFIFPTCVYISGVDVSTSLRRKWISFPHSRSLGECTITAFGIYFGAGVDEGNLPSKSLCTSSRTEIYKILVTAAKGKSVR